MLGWFIKCYEKPETIVWRESSYSRQISNVGPTLGTWSSALGGTDWLNALIKENKTELLAHNGGYPLIYSVRAEHLFDYLKSKPSLAQLLAKIADLPLDREVIVEVWDQS